MGHCTLNPCFTLSSLMDKKYTICMVGTFDLDNYGDLLFPIVAEHELQKRLKSPVDIKRFSYNRKHADEWYYEVLPFTEFDQHIESSDGLLMGGGHLMRFDPHVAKDYFPAPHTHVHHPTGYWLQPVLTANTFGVPSIWNCISASANTPEFAKPIVAHALSHSKYVAVRDESSRKEVYDTYYQGSCAVVPDTILNISQWWSPSMAREKIQPILNKYCIYKPYMVIQATPYLFEVAQNLLISPLGKTHQFIVLPMGPILGDSNQHLAELLLMNQGNVVFLTEWPNPLEIASLIACSQGSLALNHHLMMTSLSYGLPVLCPRTHYPEYPPIHASSNIHLWDDGNTISTSFIERVNQSPELCQYVQDAQSMLDKHWCTIANIIQTYAHQKSPPNHTNHVYNVWNDTFVLAERAAAATHR